MMIKNKSLRYLCGGIGAVLVFMIIGTVGGMEEGYIELDKGFINSMIYIFLLAVIMWVLGGFNYD